MDTKWGEKTLAQKVRYVCGAVLTVAALIFLLATWDEPWEFALPLSLISLGIGSILRDWDLLKEGDRRSKRNLVWWSIIMILATLLILRNLFR